MERIVLQVGDVEALAGILARLTREGERGASFAVAQVIGSEVYVQFAGSPRETTMLWEAVGVGTEPSERCKELLRELGFAAPGEQGTSPNYHQEFALGDDPDATILRVTLGSFRVLTEGWGIPANALLEVAIHMGAWEDDTETAERGVSAASG